MFQVLFDREAVVDQRLTLHCVANPTQLTDIVSFAVGPFASQQQIVERMVAAAGAPPISVGQGTQGAQANQLMTAKQYPRGYGCFGKVGKYLADIANDNFLTTFQDGRQSYLTEMYNADLTSQVIYRSAARTRLLASNASFWRYRQYHRYAAPDFVRGYLHGASGSQVKGKAAHTGNCSGPVYGISTATLTA